MASLLRSACTGTSIASICWANKRRGCHRAMPHYSSKGFGTLNSISLSPKRLLSCRKLGNTLVPLPLNGNDFFVSWTGHILLAILYGKVVIIPMELSSGKFLLIKFRSLKEFWQWILFEQTRIFRKFVPKKSGKMKGLFSFRSQSRIRFCLHLLPTNCPAYYWDGFVYLSSDQIDLTPNILASMITTTCLLPPLPPTASYKMTIPDELNE